jgi:alpha/beta superfamily hydrolase
MARQSGSRCSIENVSWAKGVRHSLLTLVLWLALGASAAFAQPARFTGFFGGGYGHPGAFTYTQIELEQREQALRGKIYQPSNRTDTPAIEKLEIIGNRINFRAGDLVFNLWRTQTGLQGTVRTPATETLPAYFAIRPGSPPAGLLRRFEGTYNLPDGRLITLSRNNDGGGFWYVELPSGRTGFLFNLSETEFLAGPCLYCAGPEYLRVRFNPGAGNSLVSRVSLRIAGKQFIGERTRTYREQQVNFAAKDGKRLAGSLFLPAGQPRHPAVVLVHGSGGQTRNGYFGHIRFMAEAYARSGVAALAYDKRGTGESAGNYDTAGFATLADDAAAALRYLATRKDIRHDRLGLSGASQAGWLVPMAATRFGDAKTLQIRVGSAPMGVEESERRRLVRQMQADGFTAQDIATALHVRTLMDSYARSSRGWEKLTAAAEPVKNEYWMQKYIGGLPPKDSADWRWLREAFSYDVRGDFERYQGGGGKSCTAAAMR